MYVCDIGLCDVVVIVLCIVVDVVDVFVEVVDDVVDFGIESIS